MHKPIISYTLTDEAPALATQSFLPIVRQFLKSAHIDLKTYDISLAGRILAQFPDFLTCKQQVDDALAQLASLSQQAEANIIKLPNISASIPQLQAAIRELQDKGFAIPDYPTKAETPQQMAIQERYAKVLGSAVNPVLREGNSDRRAPAAVKEYARKYPHSMGQWHPDSKTTVASMSEGDFYDTEQSRCCPQETTVDIVLLDKDGQESVLKANLSLEAGEIIDTAVMRVQQLRAFLASTIASAKDNDTLLSVHLKATMMKVSDPILFGHAVSVYFQSVFEKHAAIFNTLEINPNNGLASLYEKIEKLDETQRLEIIKDIQDCLKQGPELAMVDSDKGISNLHVPSHVIIDASMPAMIRNSGKMYNAQGKLQDTTAIIPDRSYAGVYQCTIDYCKRHGAFDPATMGSVANIGLMAKKAEEYGSHDKTFLIPHDGKVIVRDHSGEILFSHDVTSGDIWRMCQTKDAPVKDWVKLAVNRARLTQSPAIFWLDPQRSHDQQIIAKVKIYLSEHDTQNLDIQIMSPVDATLYTLDRLKKGLDTISVTGNVLRDYLTDLFPILELGTSAKMLSIVPLMNGGGLFETGAGGSAPKHVQQLIEENHLRWDSLGEFLALAVSLEHLGHKFKHEQALILAHTLDQATTDLLMNNQSPGRHCGELDNRGSHYYIARYWAEHLARQNHQELKQVFTALADLLAQNEEKILSELNQVQGQAVDLGGYYLPDRNRSQKIMRPSQTLNHLVDTFI